VREKEGLCYNFCSVVLLSLHSKHSLLKESLVQGIKPRTKNSRMG